jgi:hypothetical protein
MPEQDVVMPDMRERIGLLQTQAAAERQRQEEARQASTRLNEKYYLAARGLGTLATLLSDSKLPPLGWALFKDVPGGPRKLIEPRIIVASSGRTWSEKRKYTDPFWILGEWEDSSSDSGSYSHYTAHNHISQSKKVWRPVIATYAADLDELGPDNAGQLRNSLGPTSPRPKQIAEQIIWTAAHYNLDWPANAPDLGELLDDPTG